MDVYSEYSGCSSDLPLTCGLSASLVSALQVWMDIDSEYRACSSGLPLTCGFSASLVSALQTGMNG